MMVLLTPGIDLPPLVVKTLCGCECNKDNPGYKEIFIEVMDYKYYYECPVCGDKSEFYELPGGCPDFWEDEK